MQSKAKQSGEGYMREDLAEVGMSQRSRALFTQHLALSTGTNFRLHGVAL